MKLALIGQSAFGKSVLEKLSDPAEHEIVGVFAAPDTRRSREPLAAAADELELPVWQFNRMRDQECIDVFRALDADLCVMAYVTDIVPNEMIDAPIHGTIQYHPSLLPLHRGPSSINWAIINGDAGNGAVDLLARRRDSIRVRSCSKNASTSAPTTPLDHYISITSIRWASKRSSSRSIFVADGAAPRTVQDESAATYEGWCGTDDGHIDWVQEVSTVHNLIRGCDPQPGAWSKLNDEKVALFGSSVNSSVGESAQPGTVLTVDPIGMTVATGDGSVNIKRARVGRGPKSAASESGFSVGDRFS